MHESVNLMRLHLLTREATNAGTVIVMDSCFRRSAS
jgi:hypothetical protein